jgi:steroid 5-alpha reductase family enzyme
MLSLLYCLLFNLVVAIIGSWDGSLPSYPLCFIGFTAVGIQGFVFLHASGIIFGNERTEKFFDLTGSLTYISLITLSISLHGGIASMSPRQSLLSLLVIIWAIRLGTFLFSRIQRHGGIDNRFTVIKPDFNRFCRAWGLQGVWVFLTALPVFLLNDQINDSQDLTPRDYIGLTIWVVGFSFECLADYQKSIWKKKNTFINQGLWAISRHPNCKKFPFLPLSLSHSNLDFGEITLWFGIFLSASSGYTKLNQWISLISPLFVALLLIYVSGIPLLEKLANEKYKDSKEYKQYKATVPVLIPFVGRRGDAKF